MRLRFVIIFLLIMIVPLGAAAVLGVKVASDEHKLSQHQFQSLLEGRLADVKNAVRTSFDELELHLLEEIAEAPPGPDKLRELSRNEPFVRQAFVLDAKGDLVFPVLDDTTSAQEREFLERTSPIWNRKAVLYDPPGNEGTADPRFERRGSGDSVLRLASKRSQGWITWYWQEGLHLLFWRRSGTNGVVGVEVERIALLSRVVGRLPTTELDDGRIILVDSKGDPVYQWGPHEVQNGEAPVASLALDYPLDAWQLRFFPSKAQRSAIAGGSVRLNLILGLVAVAIALLGMAIYFYREYARRMREAAQRVSFVTQVSHELKTPLTNIRLYAELLEEAVDEDDEQTGRRLSVIVSESQRLTRLINNILTFSKQRRNTQVVSGATIDVDAVIASTLSQFEPSLESKGVACATDLAASEPVHADPDAVEQIIANLVSNVEKYAAGGGMLEVTSRQNERETTITVSDRGPGIPKVHRDKIFAPFFRVSDKLADGVTGTGIGLTIAKELAVQSGGELELIEADTGTCFQLTLPNRAQSDRGR